MHRLLRRLLPWLLLPSLAMAATSLENARRAEALLGREAWTRVIRIENTARDRVYPRTVHALVFEFSGLLWFYADVNGTQSFSLHANDLAAEQADFGPLLRAIEPGFGAYTIVPGDAVGRGRHPDGSLRNGCFVEAVAGLREAVERGEVIGRARLLSFYGWAAGSAFGHTVVTYETPRGAFVLDPQEREKPWHFSRRLDEDPKRVAKAVRPGVEVTEARWVPTKVPANRALLAATGSPPKTPGRSPGAMMQ